MVFSPYSFSHPLSVAPKCSLALRSRHFVGVVLPQCVSPETLPNSRVPEHFLRATSLGVTHATGLWVTRERHQHNGAPSPAPLELWSCGLTPCRAFPAPAHTTRFARPHPWGTAGDFWSVLWCPSPPGCLLLRGAISACRKDEQ